jgi:hypothetical protein
MFDTCVVDSEARSSRYECYVWSQFLAIKNISSFVTYVSIFLKYTQWQCIISQKQQHCFLYICTTKAIYPGGIRTHESDPKAVEMTITPRRRGNFLAIIPNFPTHFGDYTKAIMHFLITWETIVLKPQTDIFRRKFFVPKWQYPCIHFCQLTLL